MLFFSLPIVGIVNSNSAASARHLFADINVPFSEEQHLKRLYVYTHSSKKNFKSSFLCLFLYFFFVLFYNLV